MCPSRAVGARQARYNTPEQVARAVRRWQKALKHINWLPRLRWKWAAVGWYLNQPEVVGLTQGLARRGGVLHRVLPAAVATAKRAAKAKVKAKAKPRL